MSRPRALLAMTRPSQIVLILLVLANGALLGAHGGGALRPDSLMAGTALVVLAAVAVHLANEAADHETDRLTARTPFSGGSGALAASGLDHRVPLVAGLAVAGVVALATIVLVAGEWLSLAAGLLLLLGLLGGLAYSLPPVAAMRHGWGEPLNATLGGLLLPLSGVALVAGAVATRHVIAFLPFLFVVLASVMATAWPDRAADAATGKRTMQVRLPPPTLRRIHVAASVAFVAATALSWATGAMPFAVAGLLVTPALIIGAARYTRTRSPSANVAAMVGLAVITAVVLVIAVGGAAT